MLGREFNSLPIFIMRNTILVLLYLFAALSTFAQSKIVGQVLSKDLGPLANTSVLLNNAAIGSITDSSGTFLLQLNSPDNIKDTISFVNISYFTQKISVKHFLELPDQRIYLHPKAYTIKEFSIVSEREDIKTIITSAMSNTFAQEKDFNGIYSEIVKDGDSIIGTLHANIFLSGNYKRLYYTNLYKSNKESKNFPSFFKINNLSALLDLNPIQLNIKKFVKENSFTIIQSNDSTMLVGFEKEKRTGTILIDRNRKKVLRYYKYQPISKPLQLPDGKLFRFNGYEFTAEFDSNNSGIRNIQRHFSLSIVDPLTLKETKYIVINNIEKKLSNNSNPSLKKIDVGKSMYLH